MKYKIEIERNFSWYVINIGGFFLFGWLLQLVWNAFIPELFGLPALGYWQSVGLMFIVDLLKRGGSYLGRYKVKVEED